MGLYDAALAALEKYQMEKVLPEKFDKDNPEHATLNQQIQAYGDELQEDIDEAQRLLDQLEEFERVWNTKRGRNDPTERTG